MELITKKQTYTTKITLMGVGGAGGNAVNSMVSEGLTGVEFVAANTDAQDLNKSLADRKIQLGTEITKGLGAGGKPEVGKKAAEESEKEIAEILKGSGMLIISAGMGGGTGTGAAPVIASIARSLKILTMAIVSLPFDYEGPQRKEKAKKGIDELASAVDALIVFPNNKISKIYKVPLFDAFKKTDEVISNSAQAIIEIVNKIGHINLDFADIESVMRDSGYALIGTGTAEGDDRAIKAADIAISNPLLADIDLSGCTALIVSTILGYDFMPHELDQIMEIITSATGQRGNIKPGIIFDPNMDGKAKVTIIATGLTPSDAINNLSGKVNDETIITPFVQPQPPKPDFIKSEPLPPPYLIPQATQETTNSPEYNDMVNRINKHNTIEVIPQGQNTITAMTANNPSFGKTEMPAFLKKQFN